MASKGKNLSEKNLGKAAGRKTEQRADGRWDVIDNDTNKRVVHTLTLQEANYADYAYKKGKETGKKLGYAEGFREASGQQLGCNIP